VLAGLSHGESSAAVRARVTFVRERQRERQGVCNALLSGAALAHCSATPAAERLLARAVTRMVLSARGYHRVLKVARTIADLADATSVDGDHVAEALAYRRFDEPASAFQNAEATATRADETGSP